MSMITVFVNKENTMCVRGAPWCDRYMSMHFCNLHGLPCIVVDEWAGSTPNRSRIMGSIAPRQTLLNTMIHNAAVTAKASGKSVLKKIARQNPAILRIIESAAAILNSLVKNCPLVLSFKVPNANPRITTIPRASNMSDALCVTFGVFLSQHDRHRPTYLARSLGSQRFHQHQRALSRRR